MVSPIVWRTAKERRFYTHVLGIGRAFSLSSVGHFISKAWRALLAGVRDSTRSAALGRRPPSCAPLAAAATCKPAPTIMLAYLACADAVERHRPVTLEASLDSMGRESHPANAHLEFFAAFERHLDAGRLTKAKKHLARMPPDLRARQYNAAGLVSLLEGNLASAMSFLRRADSEPFGPAHLAIRKNLYWLAYRNPEAADDNERIDSTWSAVMSAFERSHDAGMPSKDVSMFDVGIQRRICNHAMYDRNRHAAMWEGVSEAERWRVQYLELVKKAVTDYLHRDLTEEFRDSSEPASTVPPPPLPALRYPSPNLNACPANAPPAHGARPTNARATLSSARIVLSGVYPLCPGVQ